MISPPSFIVGYDMSLQIVGALVEQPLLSNHDIAIMFGADEESPFFKTDLEIARILLSDPDGYHRSDEFQRLATIQSRNVMLCVGLEIYGMITDRFGPQDDEGMKRWHDIVSFLSNNPISIRHIDMAIQTRKIMEEIAILAGDRPVDSETIIVEYVRHDLEFLSAGSDVDSDLLENLIEGVCDGPSVIRLDGLISAMLGSIDTEDRRNGSDRDQAQDATQGHDG
mgnify:CR=1 FL=1